MAFRFWRRARIAPGITLNLSKRGASISLGPRGAKYTIGTRGKRATLGLPGTGLFYTTQMAPDGQQPQLTVPRPARLTPSFFQKLTTPRTEKAFAAGCRELSSGSEQTAVTQLRKVAALPSGAYLLGFLCLKRKLYEEAAKNLKVAAAKANRVRTLFDKYGISPNMAIAITPEVTAWVPPDTKGILLGLVEAHQALGQKEEALKVLRRLHSLGKSDPVVRLSLAEVLFDTGEKRQIKEVAKLANVQNTTFVHTGILLYRVRALRKLGLPTAAIRVASKAVRKRRDRPPALLHALRYELALAHLQAGDTKRCREEIEKLYAEAPDYGDVLRRLGLK